MLKNKTLQKSISFDETMKILMKNYWNKKSKIIEWHKKPKHIIRNKKLEYSIGNNREHMKVIGENYRVSQRAFSEYCTTMFNLMKFSKFSI